MFENFPYSNFHDLNTDWIINLINQIKKEWEEQKSNYETFKQSLEDYIKDYLDDLKNEDLKNYVFEWLDEHPEATTTVENNSITIEKLNTSLLQYQTKHFSKNSDYAVSKMGEVALSYIKNKDMFTYGGRYTAFRNNIALIDGKYQINCSSFAMLLLFGISFENSAYTLGANKNITDDDLCTDIDLLEWFASENEGQTGDNRYKYTYDLAKYLNEHGYCFTPNDDLSNIKSGDLLLMKNQTGSESQGTYLEIDHSAVFAYWSSNNTYHVWEVGSLPSDEEYTKQNLVDNCVLVARFPFSNKEEKIENKLKLREYVSNSDYPTMYVYHDTFNTNKYYTITAKLTYEDSIENVYPTIYQNANRLIGYNNATEKPKDDTYTFVFNPLTNDSLSIRMNKISTDINQPVTTITYLKIVEGIRTSKQEINTDKQITLTASEGFSITTNSQSDNFQILQIRGNLNTGTNALATVNYNILHGTITPCLGVAYASTGTTSDIEFLIYNHQLQARNNTGSALENMNMYIIVPIYK